MHVSNQCRLARDTYGPDVRNVVTGICDQLVPTICALLNDDVRRVAADLPISTLQPRSLSPRHA